MDVFDWHKFLELADLKKTTRKVVWKKRKRLPESTIVLKIVDILDIVL
jgi:hypothetical protein